MKKIFSVIAVLFVSGMLLAAQGVEEPKADETLVKVTGVTVSDDGTYRIEAVKNGENVIYNASAETTETEEGYPLSSIEEGDYILVRDNGMMTMSIPPQFPAASIRDASAAVEAGLIDPSTGVPAELPEITIAIGNVDPENSASTFNYSYGYLSMKALMLQNLYPRAGYFARGVMDASLIQEKTPLLEVDEMSSSLDSFITNVYGAGEPTDYGDVITTEEEILALPYPETLEDKFAYSYGYFTVLNLMYGGVEIIGPDFAAGVLAAIYDAEPLFTEEEMNAYLDKYISEMQAEYEAYLKELAESNKKEAEAYLEDNKAREGVIALDSGVQLEFILDDTTEGASPAADDTVNVNYTLTLMNGNVMDQGENVEFNLQSLIPGFTEAVMHMTVGDTVRAYIPPELGYGETGTPTIEPNSLLIFEITLNSIVPPAESAE